MTFIVVMGAPGSGKGTQARLLEQQVGLPHIATGELFRKHFENESDLGRRAKAYVEAGELVPDQLTIEMVGERLALPDCCDGALLDGFPRTHSQAEALDALLQAAGGAVDLVIYLDVSPPVLLERLSGRWVCRQCGGVYHATYRPMRLAGICDFCRGNVVQLSYDTDETQRRRIRLFFEQTEPLLAYYRGRGVLYEVEGEQPVNVVNRLLRRRVDKLATGPLASR